ncbi:MAG: flagellar hook-associated protein FlgL [Idiomarina sp.]
MRLSTSLIFSRGLNSVLNTQQALSKVQDQLSAQTKILSPADDPIGKAQVMALDEKIGQNDQFQRNSTTLENNLKREESVLANITTAVDRARVLAIQAGNGTMSVEDRKALALELESLESEVFDLMNAQDESGEYIFAGFQNREESFLYNSAKQTYEYNGDDGQRLLQMSPSLKLAAGDPGSSVFTKVSDRISVSRDAGSTTSDAVFTVNDRQGFIDQLDVLYDDATPANNYFNVEIQAGNQFQVTDSAGAVLAGPSAYTPGEPIRFAGASFAFEEPPAAGQTLTVNFDEPVERNLATAIGDLARSLRNNGDDELKNWQNEIGFALDDFSKGKDAVVSARASVGARLNVMDNARNSNFDFQIVNKDARSRIQDVDYATAITELTKQETVLQASQQVYVRINRLSLFNFL